MKTAEMTAANMPPPRAMVPIKLVETAELVGKGGRGMVKTATTLTIVSTAMSAAVRVTPEGLCMMPKSVAHLAAAVR
jgi:hypothetical protein